MKENRTKKKTKHKRKRKEKTKIYKRKKYVGVKSFEERKIEKEKQENK